MKRDMNLVREILLATERLASDDAMREIAGVDMQDFAHHIDILCDAGMLIGETVRAADGTAVAARAKRLTWQGHDMLDSLRKGA